jgi:hypothetical protein
VQVAIDNYNSNNNKNDNVNDNHHNINKNNNKNNKNNNNNNKSNNNNNIIKKLFHTCSHVFIAGGDINAEKKEFKNKKS